jgi:hypothetical protein
VSALRRTQRERYAAEPKLAERTSQLHGDDDDDDDDDRGGHDDAEITALLATAIPA